MLKYVVRSGRERRKPGALGDCHRATHGRRVRALRPLSPRRLGPGLSPRRLRTKQCKAKKRAQVRKKCHRTVRKHNRVKRTQPRPGGSGVPIRTTRPAVSDRSCRPAPGRLLAGARKLLQLSQPVSAPEARHPVAAAREASAARGVVHVTGALAWTGNGTIRIATWSFNDWQIARALVGAHRARRECPGHRRSPSESPPTKPGGGCVTDLERGFAHPSVAQSADRVSFARQCRGSCRGGGGTPHAKYMLIDRVGPTQTRRRGHPDLDEPDEDGFIRDSGTRHRSCAPLRSMTTT